MKDAQDVKKSFLYITRNSIWNISLTKDANDFNSLFYKFPNISSIESDVKKLEFPTTTLIFARKTHFDSR